MTAPEDEKDDLWAEFDSGRRLIEKMIRAPWDSASSKEGDHAHFVFVEDVEKIEDPTVLDAPTGDTISARHRVFKNRPIRFRTSGPDIVGFMTNLERFENLNENQISDSQRQKRRENLIALFNDLDVPIIDIYVSRRDDDFRRMNALLQPGSWWIAQFRDDQEGIGGEKPVFYADPEAGEENATAVLRRLAPVPREIRARLSDIFSLNHVPDARFTEGGDDSGLPSAAPPLTGPLTPGGGAVAVYSGMRRKTDEERMIRLALKRRRTARTILKGGESS